jgi:hypothetical protein
MNHDDDELFSILERAIGPTSDDAPTDAERQRLRATVDDVHQHRPVPITAARSRRWIRRTVATGLGSIVVVSGATAVAAAVNDGVLPAPARSVARSIGLPVESADLAKARAALGRLRKADDDERDAVEGEVQLALSRLSASDLAKIDAAATAALQNAHDLDEQLAANGGSGSSGSNSGSGSSGSGSSGSGSGSSGSGSSGSGSSGSGSSGSGDGSTTSTIDDGGDHGGEASTSTSTPASTATTDDHSDGGDDTTSTSTAITSTSTTDDHHGGDGDGGGEGKSGGDGSDGGS